MAQYNLRKHPKTTQSISAPDFIQRSMEPDMASVQLQEPVKGPNPTTGIPICCDEDESGSDVSASPSDIEDSSQKVQQHPQIGPDHLPASTPNEMPHLQAETLSAIKQRLAELDAVEDTLVTKRKKLITKRKRKDERIKSRISEEEARIKRQREEDDARRIQDRLAKEVRIRKRREREDDDYRKKEKAHDDEEYELRRRLKTLKRGHPVDDEIIDSPQMRKISESMSPPAKKHQPNVPVVQTLNSPPISSTVQALQNQKADQAPPAQYPYYYGWNPPPVPGHYAYGPSNLYQQQNQPNVQQQNPRPQHNPLPSAPLQNGGPPRFNPPPPPIRQGPSPNANPPRADNKSPHHHQPELLQPPGGPSQYDIQPPSTAASFTPVNAPSSGFPSINQPPTRSMKTPLRPASKAKRANQLSAKAQPQTIESAVQHSPIDAPEKSPTTSTPVAGGKRKASTTHPYSQSEAFANRHHHCERTDELDRGIWTYFGPGGTKEAPTVAGKKEMYLRCDHDDCMRIDWKTVHGLQCHIVKNHGIPKGTIGSLELALEKYGVEVQEIEDHEKKHGLGSAGTVAEKPARGRPRNRPSDGTDMSESAGPTPGPTAGPVSVPSTKPPSIARPKPSGPIILFPNLQARSPSGGYVQDDIVYSEDESDGDGDNSSASPRPRAPKPTTHPPRWRQASDVDSSDPSFTTTTTSKPQKNPSPRKYKPRTSAAARQTNPHPEPSPQRWVSPTPPEGEPYPTKNSPPLPTEPLSPPRQSSANLALDPIPQNPPPLDTATDTQRLSSATERVNPRLEARDPDFVPSTASTTTTSTAVTAAATVGGDAEVGPRPQIQSQTQSPDSHELGVLGAKNAVGKTEISTTTTTASAPTARPRGGAERERERERRVKVSERWDWVSVEDEEEGDKDKDKEMGRDEEVKQGNGVGGADGGGDKRVGDVNNGNTSGSVNGGGGVSGGKTGIVLTKAQLELQGIDGSLAENEADGNANASSDGRGDHGGGSVAGAPGGGEDGSEGAVTAKSPATARISARKKTRRRVVD